jgi:predicted  nucleic acid-binding Zn-ribbon protein
MRPFFPILFILIGLVLGRAVPAFSEPTPTPISGLSVAQWEEIYARFEGVFHFQTSRLDNLQKELEKNQRTTQDLDSQIAEIRKNKEPGVFDQLRLNHLLNDLKDHLEKNSALQRSWSDSQKEQEQKGLSLIALLNDRIEGMLEKPTTDPGVLTPTLTTLTELAQKRRQVQATLDRYQPRKETKQSPPISAFRTLGTSDPESLQITMDLLRERERTLEDEKRKLLLETDGLQDEMKMQKKMKDFLAGIKRMNQDSGAPPESFDRTDLSRLYGGKNPEKLSAHLLSLQNALSKNRSAHDQIEQLIANIQERQNSLQERKKK